jgi:hypothetical protein
VPACSSRRPTTGIIGHEIAYRELIRGRRRRAMIVVAILAVLIVMIYLL